MATKIKTQSKTKTQSKSESKTQVPTQTKTKVKIQSKKSKVYCGVCSDWEIKRPEKCSNTMIHKGAKVYFCTRKCKDRFSKTPEKFL